VFEAAAESAAEVGPWMFTWRHGASLDRAAAHVAESIAAWQSGEWYDFAITPADSPLPFLGRAGIDFDGQPPGCANVGYWVRTSRTGQGIASRSVRLLARFAFEDLGLQRLELVIATRNDASRRVAEKAGAVYEGTRPAGGRNDDDSWVFVLRP
jgi:ribosomal-protein-serine acetyltransferase